MNVGSINNTLVAFSIFDTYMAGMKKIDQARNPPASPLVDAAFQAFEGYLATVETQHAAQISGAAYMLNAKATGATLISRAQMAPLLALNILG